MLSIIDRLPVKMESKRSRLHMKMCKHENALVDFTILSRTKNPNTCRSDASKKQLMICYKLAVGELIQYTSL